MTADVQPASTLAAALVAFQAEVTDVGKASTATIQPRDKTKAAFSFPYADLADRARSRPPGPHQARPGRHARRHHDGTDDVQVTTIVLHAVGGAA